MKGANTFFKSGEAKTDYSSSPTSVSKFPLPFSSDLGNSPFQDESGLHRRREIPLSAKSQVRHPDDGVCRATLLQKVGQGALSFLEERLREPFSLCVPREARGCQGEYY